MRTLQKGLTLILALVLLLGLMTVPAHAEGGLTGNGNVATTYDSTLYMDLYSMVSYNGEPVTKGNVTFTDASVPDIGSSFVFAGYDKSELKDGILALSFKPDLAKATTNVRVTLTYTMGGASATETVLLPVELKDDGLESYTGKVEEKIDPSTLQSAYDITLCPTPIAQDDKDHAIDIQMHLAYQGDKNFQNAPLSFFRIEPVVSGVTAEFPFKLEYSSYGKTMKDIKVVKDKDGKIIDTYFDFPFKVKSDAVNGYYPVTFKLHHLFSNVHLDDAAPVETTITTYVEIRNGKKASESTTPGTPTIDPSTAILLLEGYELSTDEIRAGDTFDITLKIRNTSKKKVTDVKSTLTEGKGTVLPVSGAPSFYVEEIGAGEVYEKTLTLKAQMDAGVVPVDMTLSNSFVHEDTAKTSSDSFILPVTQIINLSLDAPSYPTEIYMGDSMNLMMSLYNKGKSMIYNVSVYLESEGLKADENYYAGNMDSGSSKTYDVMVSPVEGFEGQIDGDIVVTFEDALGNVSERRTPISVNVAAMDWGGDVWEDIPMEPMEEPKAKMPWWGWGLIGVGGAGAGVGVPVACVKHHRKKKQQLEDEDEME